MPANLKQLVESAPETSEVQKIIEELVLEYVAGSIVTYDDVNAAQQAFCEALVEIGRLNKEGEGYTSYAEKFLTDAYNYDYGKVFFYLALVYGDQAFRIGKKGASAFFVGDVIIQVMMALP